jgi:sec-independent protein translocase protein TatA
MIIVLVVAVLLFGKRLPEVARSLGKGVAEFRRGVSGIEEVITKADYAPSQAPRVTRDDDRDEPTAPKFEPPPSDAAPLPAEAMAASTPIHTETQSEAPVG